jgi:hypothetical protein
MLRRKSLANDPTDPLRRIYSGWDPLDSLEENWANNHGYYKIGRRAEEEEFVLFSFRPTQRIVMAAEIHAIVDAIGKPGKRIVEGSLLRTDHTVWQTLVGQRTPEHCLVRNPVTYPPIKY